MFKRLSLLAAGLLVSLAAWAAPTVEMTTNLGKITLELYPEKAPKTVEFFLYNAKHGFYEATIFHRVIDGFMIQGGGFNSSMEEKKTRTPALQNEANNGLSNDRGTVAMARTQDPHSARVQFFINLKDNSSILDKTTTNVGYAVFASVTAGTDVVTAMTSAPCQTIAGFITSSLGCVPIPNVVISTARQTR